MKQKSSEFLIVEKVAKINKSGKGPRPRKVKNNKLSKRYTSVEIKKLCQRRESVFLSIFRFYFQFFSPKNRASLENDQVLLVKEIYAVQCVFFWRSPKKSFCKFVSIDASR